MFKHTSSYLWIWVARTSLLWMHLYSYYVWVSCYTTFTAEINSFEQYLLCMMYVLHYIWFLFAVALRNGIPSESSWVTITETIVWNYVEWYFRLERDIVNLVYLPIWDLSFIDVTSQFPCHSVVVLCCYNEKEDVFLSSWSCKTASD